MSQIFYCRIGISNIQIADESSTELDATTLTMQIDRDRPIPEKAI